MLDYRLQLGLHFLGLLCTNIVASDAISDADTRKLVAAISSTMTMFLAHYSLKTPPPGKG